MKANLFRPVSLIIPIGRGQKVFFKEDLTCLNSSSSLAILPYIILINPYYKANWDQLTFIVTGPSLLYSPCLCKAAWSLYDVFFVSYINEFFEEEKLH